MQFTKQQVNLWPVQILTKDANNYIAAAARTCYKSEPISVSEQTDTEFVERLIRNKHLAMLEHGTVILYGKRYKLTAPTVEKYMMNPFSKVIGTTDGHYIIVTNRRVIYENGWEQDVVNFGVNSNVINNVYTSVLLKDAPLRRTFSVTTTLQVAMQLIRHRLLSYAMESTRWCNYSKDKFGNQLTFIMPDVKGKIARFFVKAYLKACEKLYMFLVKRNKAEIAATILPKCLATNLVLTGFVDDFKDFFSKRASEETGRVLPLMKELASKMQELLTTVNE